MRVSGVHNPSSLGIHRYTGRLAAALARADVEYVPGRAPVPGTLPHLHLGNSSRTVVRYAVRLSVPYIVTVHDVLPRARVLGPVYDAFVFPLCIRRADCVIVHSRFAADLLMEKAGVERRRIAIVPHPASAPSTNLDARAARETIGMAPDGPPLFVVPGILKSAKRIDELVRAAKPLLAAGTIRLLLAGRVVDGASAEAARRAGAHVIDRPDDDRYERAIQAADVVVCVRARSVGESNGPLLDAIGAGKAVLASKIGSIPEVAGKAAWYVPADASVNELRDAFRDLAIPELRLRRASVAAERAEELSWDTAALMYQELFERAAAPARRSPAGVAVTS